MILLMLAALPLVNSQEWNYGSLGPSTWGDGFSQCGEPNQSPVDIDTDKLETDSSLNAFGFHNFDKKANNELENTGHTAIMVLGIRKRVYVYNGGLEGSYVVVGFHFRWGSEHTVDGNRSPLELQIVCFNRKFPTMNDAIEASNTEPDSVINLAVLFEISSSDNKNLDPLVTALEQVQTAGSKVKVRGRLRFKDLLPFSAATNYYRYQGRFSNPPCFYTLWTVFSDTVLISETQLEAFKRLKDKDGNPLKDTFRPTQQLGNRVIKSSMPPLRQFDPGVPNKSCVDVFLVIDESCSVYDDMHKVKEFLLDLVDRIIIGTDAVLMSLVRYSAPVTMNFYHSNTTNNDVVMRLIDTQPLGQRTTCRTHTSEALKFNLNRFFGLHGGQRNETTQRDYGIRTVAPDVMIIITDGISIPMRARTSALAEAAKLRGHGVEIYTIGLKNQNARNGYEELHGFTGGKDDHVFDINNDGLAGHFAHIINSYDTCTGEKNCSDQLDIVLVIDTSQSLLTSSEWDRITKNPDNHHEINSEHLIAVKEFFKQLLAAIPIGIDKVRVAIVSFDEVVRIHQYLDDTTDYAGTNDILTNSVIDYTGVGTRTDAALRYVLNRVLKKDRGDRVDVNNFIMLATDGVAYPCCTASCCHMSTGTIQCPTTDYPCITQEDATREVERVAKKLKANWRNDVYVLALPNRPDRGDPFKKHAAAKKAMLQYEALVRNTITGIKTLEQFNELENIVKEIVNRVCAAADGIYLSPPSKGVK
ncbi:unnamed protein product [Owenia fusiformis]|uniref:VWFA domain-containing protein n=1 Tax=Owenia fusiformis TaxID=6347 RepID=A0A8S4MUP3_OWEFU|nr:unnamed protein product [Owenia fusiformis]